VNDGGQAVIGKCEKARHARLASFIRSHQSVAIGGPYERNHSLRINRQGRPRTDAW
jgi:hypothetical protein